MSNLVKAEDEKSAKTKGSRSNKRELKNLEQEILKSTDLSTEEKLQVVKQFFCLQIICKLYLLLAFLSL